MSGSQARVTGPVMLPDGMPAEEHARIVFQLSDWDREDGGLVMHGRRTAIVEAGAIDIELWRNAAGDRATTHEVFYEYWSDDESDRIARSLGKIYLTGPGPFLLADLLSLPTPVPTMPGELAQAIAWAGASKADADRAEEAAGRIDLGALDEAVSVSTSNAAAASGAAAQTAGDRVATAGDRVATAADRVATSADRSQTGNDAAASASARAAAEAARDAAIAAGTWDYRPVDNTALAAITGMTAGQTAYVRTTTHVWAYSGSAWVDTGTSPISDKADGATFSGVSEIVPVAVGDTARGRVAAVWLKDGVAQFAGHDPDPLIAQVPVASDGRSLWRARAAAARIRAGEAGALLKVMCLGDSWFDLPFIARALRARLVADHGDGGPGYRSVKVGSSIGSAYLVRTGSWVDIDAPPDNPPWAHPLGLDGRVAYSSTPGDMMSWVNLQVTQAQIVWRRANGSFRHRYNGGAWNTVTTASADGSRQIVNITGTDTIGAIDIEVLSGTVAINDLYGRRATGAQVIKAGNDGLYGKAWMQWMSEVAPYAASLLPDVVVVSLATNDYRWWSSPPSVYVEALRSLVTRMRAAHPGIGFIFIAPPKTNGVAVVPLVHYRDALIRMCIADGHEYLDAFTSWPSFAEGNAAGLYRDDLHASDVTGSDLLAGQIYNSFFRGI